MDQTTSPPEKPIKELESKTGPDDVNELQIPDGGWGWVVCFAGFMINFTAVGLVASNGIILLGLIDLFNDNMSKTSMVGSLFMGISMCVGKLPHWKKFLRFFLKTWYVAVWKKCFLTWMFFVYQVR